MPAFNREQLAWCAGFFDGEGNVCVSRGAIRSQTVQINRLVLDRLVSATKLCSITGPYVSKDQTYERQPQYFYSLNNFEEVQAFVAMIWPWLGIIKRRQARAALLHYLSGSKETLANGASLHVDESMLLQPALDLTQAPELPPLLLLMVNNHG